MVGGNGDDWARKAKARVLPEARPSDYYKVYLSDKKAGFEYGEHALSRQLFFVFESLPDLKLAEDLEAMGFGHMFDERVFTRDADDEKIRQRAFERAMQFVNSTKGPAL